MNIYVCGQKHFGAAVFSALHAAGHGMLGVCAPALNDAGERDRLRARATEVDVPWTDCGRLCADILPSGIDVIVAAHTHQFIDSRTRGQANFGAIGYHPSLLPLYRGRDAIACALRAHERVTGGTVYWLSDRMDGGDIAAQEHVFVRPADTATMLWRRDLAPLGVRLLIRVCAEVEHGQQHRTPQDETLATWARALAHDV